MRTLLLMLLLVCWISSACGQEQQQATQPAGSAAKKEIAGSQANPLFVQRYKSREEKAEEDKQAADAKENLNIQRKSLEVSENALRETSRAAWAATIAAVAACFAALIAFGQFVMFWIQLHKMDESNKTAAKAATAAETAANATKSEFEASHRPWIKVKLSLLGDFVRNKSGGWVLPVEFTMTNIGNGVAQGAYPHPGFFAGEGFVDDVLKAQAQLASEFSPIADSSYVGFTIFPGDSFKVTVGIPLTANTVAEKIAPHAKMGFADCLPPLFIVGSVHYKSTISAARYRTGFIREFGSSQESKPGTRTLLPQKDVISLNELAMNQYIAGDGYID